jgi:hypothetical protein
MGDSAHTTHHTNLGKKSAPPLFLIDENFFQKSASMVRWGIQFPTVPREPIFEKSSHLREKGGVLIFFPGLYGGLYGQNLPYEFKKSYGDLWNRNFEKSHRTTGPRSDLRPDS